MLSIPMIVDDELLARLGMSDLPEDRRTQFRGEVQDEYANRVGLSLSDGLTVPQIEEFERLLLDPRAVASWLDENVPGHRAHPWYLAFCVQAPAGCSREDLDGLFAGLMWMLEHRPDYPELLARHADALRRDLEDRAWRP